MIHAGADVGLARWAGRLRVVFPGFRENGSPADGRGGRGSRVPGAPPDRRDGLALARWHGTMTWHEQQVTAGVYYNTAFGSDQAR